MGLGGQLFIGRKAHQLLSSSHTTDVHAPKEIVDRWGLKVSAQ